MALFVVLSDYADHVRRLPAGTVLDDAVFSVAELRAGGCALVPKTATVDAALSRFFAQRAQRVGDDPVGDLVAILLASQEVSGVLSLPVGDIVGMALAPVPGTADAPAMAFFGQIGVPADIEIASVHAHCAVVPAAGTDLVLEVYRADNAIPGPPTFTLIATLTQALVPGGGTFRTATAVPTDGTVPAGSYLFVQATSGTGVFDGLTIDFHYSSALIPAD